MAGPGVDASPELCIVIPALNEAASIGGVVEHALQFGLPVVVDDGSSDETGRIARQAGADVVTHKENAGYDAALRSGVARAHTLGARYVITMDADGQHNPALLGEYLDALRGGCDLVLGIRDRRQRISEEIFAGVASALYGVKDPLCGMKGFRVEILERLGHFDSYGSINTELALFAVRSGYRFTQLPVATREREGAPRFARLMRANYLILRALALSFIRIRPLHAAAR